MFRIGRWGVFLLLLLVTLAWAAGYAHLPQRIGAGLNRQPEDALEELLQSRREIDPEVANSLRRVEDSRKRRALAIVLRAESRRPTPQVSNKARMLAGGTSSSGEGAWDAALVEIALDPNRFDREQQRQEFLYAHATTLGVLDADHSHEKVSRRYIETLRRATNESNQWPVVRNDPFALLVLDQVADQTLQDFYLQERNGSDWLNEALVALTAPPVDSGDPQTDQPSAIPPERVLEVASRSHPYFKRAVQDHGVDLFLAFALFDHYGNAILPAVEKDVPQDELLEVLFANDDICDARLEAKGADGLAAYLIQIHSEKPSVWREARFSPLALRLNEDSPEYADGILEEYGDLDVAALLYSAYEEEIPQAAACVDKFGDLAIHLLSHYAEEPEEGGRKFHGSVTKFGPRLIPYTARFEDAGLERLEDNRAWLDKYFEPDGTPKESEWWTHFPGGAAAKVAQNWAQGHPNEWGELGWAAVDVADGMLLVASFGSSGVVTRSGSAAIKQTAKQTAKRTVLQSTRQKAARLSGTRSAVRPRQSLLKRATTGTVERFRDALAQPVLTRTWHILATTQRAAEASARLVLEQARRLNRSWRAVDPGRRRLVYRSLLAAGLFATLTQRTIPNLPDIGKAAGSFLAEVVDQGVKAGADFLTEAVGPILSWVSTERGLWVGQAIWLIVLCALVLAAWKSFPRKRKVRYV